MRCNLGLFLVIVYQGDAMIAASQEPSCAVGVRRDGEIVDGFLGPRACHHSPLPIPVILPDDIDTERRPRHSTCWKWPLVN
ncbi:hypothetical protein F4803DRAFT_82625 [Xylaria telfairii]|nr:hypothetical protein F4803DRAFT_82625 [Xylaria telfairii]